jgi:hypothetical protein
MGHVDDAHEPEDEGEAARDDEEQSCERDRVEEDGQERAGIVDRRPERGRPPVAEPDLGRRLRDDEDVEDHEDDQPARDHAWR